MPSRGIDLARVRLGTAAPVFLTPTVKLLTLEAELSVPILSFSQRFRRAFGVGSRSALSTPTLLDSRLAC